MIRRLRNLFLWIIAVLQLLAALAVMRWAIEPSSSSLTSDPIAATLMDIGSPDATGADSNGLTADIDRLRTRRWIPELFPKPTEPKRAAPPPALPRLQVKLLAIIQDGDGPKAVFSTPVGELLTVGVSDWLDPDSKHTRVTLIKADRVGLEHHSRPLEFTLAPAFAKE